MSLVSGGVMGDQIRKVYNTLRGYGYDKGDAGFLCKGLYALGKFNEPSLDHCVRVGGGCEKVAKKIGLLPGILYAAGVGHDLGKWIVDAGVIRKRGRLSSEEFDEVKKHPVYTYNHLKRLPVVGAVAANHHSKYVGFDLSKISNKKVRGMVRFYSGIVGAVDWYDAFTSRNDGWKNGRGLKESFVASRPEDVGLFEFLLTRGVFPVGK